MQTITVQQLEAMLRSGQPEVTHCGESLMVETKMGSIELPLSCLGTFTPKAEEPMSVDSNADTRKLVRSEEDAGGSAKTGRVWSPENGC